LRRTARRLVALGAVVLAAAANASVADAATECPSIVSVSRVTEGMTGTGWTVSRGTEPEPFGVEVLGVIPDGIAPGRDMIVVKASGPAIERAGGVWYGMSGAPIYVGGRLLGALAHGLTFGPTTIAGVTPAEHVLDLWTYPLAPPGAVGSNSSPPVDLIFLSSGLVSAIAKETNTPAREIGSALAPLRVPLGASGLSARGMRRLRTHVERARLPYVPYATSSASSAAVASGGDSFERGDNFVAALSYGDVTLSSVGTTTYVCGHKAVGFGHPLEFTGRTSMGASAAQAIAIVRDPVFGPFKLAKVRGRAGRVDQDRFAGVRAVLGESPAMTPIRTSVTAPDLARTRAGATDVVLPTWTPFITFLHLSENITSTADTAGGGSSQLSWKVEGTRPGGRSWTFSRSNRYASRSDIALESTAELATGLELIASNPFEDVRFSAVRADATVEESVRQYQIARVLVATNGSRFRELSSVRAAPGSRVRVRVVLTPSDDSPPKIVNVVLVVPVTARFGGQIDVVGAPTTPAVCFEVDFCGPGSTFVKSFDGMLRALERRRRNNVLVARLRIGFGGAVRHSKRFVLDRAVYGSKTIGVRLGCCGGATSFPTESGTSGFAFDIFGF
jgi:hypothetical protein